MPITIGSGKTIPGNTDWQPYNENGIVVQVDTSAAGFSSTPVYVTSLGGTGSMWSTSGGSSVYDPTSTSFKIYLRWIDGHDIDPALADSKKWHINWIGIQQ
jgi:hypothetical protein